MRISSSAGIVRDIAGDRGTQIIVCRIGVVEASIASGAFGARGVVVSCSKVVFGN